jgi:hypothetical protein
MIYKLIGIVCAFRSHVLVMAGSCPFTGSIYQYCERCHAMIPTQEVV